MQGVRTEFDIADLVWRRTEEWPASGQEPPRLNAAAGSGGVLIMGALAAAVIYQRPLETGHRPSRFWQDPFAPALSPLSSEPDASNSRIRNEVARH